jgi:hypothetical protein
MLFYGDLFFNTSLKLEDIYGYNFFDSFDFDDFGYLWQYFADCARAGFEFFGIDDILHFPRR